MQYPKLSVLPTKRETIDVFRGYNHNLRIGEGEFYEMENLSSDHYPLLSPRAKRGVLASPALAQGLIAKDGLCYVDGGDFVVGEERAPMGLTADGEPKTLVSMGTYVIVMPDKKYVNTADLSDHGAIEASLTTAGEVSFSFCESDGASLQRSIADTEPPSEPKHNDYWIDISETPHILRRYSATKRMWIAVTETYVRIESPGIGVPFSVGDGVFISGLDTDMGVAVPSPAVIVARNSGYIAVKGALEESFIQSTTLPITVERKMPDMDFLIESENRLWGCRYGSGVNKIYASKRGDFRNWTCFGDTEDDSYEAGVGSDGPFTGAAAHLGYPLFFKESCLHKVYGNAPSNYQVRTTLLRGVQRGCARSLATVNEVLYYKSRTGVCAYDGSLPEEISAPLGGIHYANAAAGALGNKYYISMSDESGDYHLFVYDTLRKMWHREDGTRASVFCPCRADLCYLDYATGQIRTVRATGTEQTAPIRWSATTGIIGADSPDRKYLSRLDVRMKLAVGARAAFYVSYDSSDGFEYLFTMTGKSLETFAVPIRPRRCDHLRLRIVGTGEARIFSLTKTFERGSDTP